MDKAAMVGDRLELMEALAYTDWSLTLKTLSKIEDPWLARKLPSSAAYLEVVEKEIWTKDLNRFIDIENPQDLSLTDLVSASNGWMQLPFEVAIDDLEEGVDNIKLSICNSSTQSLTIQMPLKIRTWIRCERFD